MGNVRDLDNYAYDNFLASKGKHREVRERHLERKNANKGYEGWHFGLGDKPVFTRNKEEFKNALAQRGLAMRDDIKKPLR